MVDDHRLFAEAISLSLEQAGMTVVGVATNAADGLTGAHAERPDLVLVDIGLPDQNGIELGTRILVELPETKVVALTALEEPQTVRRALDAGFHGYLSKNTDPRRFRRALETVIDGDLVFPERVGGRSSWPTAKDADSQLLADQLTAREIEVLQLLAEGASSGEIATRLSVSPNTVRTHVQGILTKLQVHSRLEAAAFAVRHDLVRPRT
jgi:two-component system, NarL family, nitrate/nitrite response regulator NarL